MMKLMPAGWRLPAVSLGLAVCVGALAQSVVTLDPGSQVVAEPAEPELRGQGGQHQRRRRADATCKGKRCCACPLNVAGLACSRVMPR